MFTRLPKTLTNGIYRLRLNRTSSGAAAVVFLVSVVIGGAFAWKTEQNRLAQERGRFDKIAEEYITDIQSNLESALSVTYTVSALVHEYQGTVPNFATVAQDLLSIYPAADTLALIADNTVEEFASLHSNAKLLSHNELKNLAPQPNSNFNNSQQVVLVIPKDSAGIGYLPVFLPQQQQQSSFWGFVGVVIDFKQLLHHLNLQRLEEEGYAYQFLCSDSEQNHLIDASIISLSDRPVTQTIEIANTSWTLSIAPAQGWNSRYRLRLKFLLVIFLSTILASVLKLLMDSKAFSPESQTIAYFDSLTSLPNQRLLLYHLERIIARTKRTGKSIAVCQLNLDNFQSINHRLGHKTGDYSLVRIAKRLQKFLRAEDIIARIGGDNFVIVLQELSNVAEAELVINRILQAIVSPITIDSEAIRVSASVGVVIYPLNNSDVETLLTYAERAMRYTKQHQKGYYTLFHNLKTTLR